MTLQIDPLLQAVVAHDGSDLHLKAGAAPRIRIAGTLVPLRSDPLSADRVETIVRETMPPNA